MRDQIQITTNKPVRYAKWPASATRKVGPVLKPGDVLVIDARDENYYRFVACGEGNSAEIELKKIRVVR